MFVGATGTCSPKGFLSGRTECGADDLGERERIGQTNADSLERERPMNNVAAYRKLVYRGRAPMRAQMRGALTAIAVALVALTSLAAPVAAGAAAGGQVPFKGSLEGLETTTGFTLPSTVSIVLEGTGNATHLGRFTLVNPHDVDLSNMTGCGPEVLTAANGDSVTAFGCGVATLVSGIPPLAVLSIVEDYEITGGTGRFAGATGSYHGRAHTPPGQPRRDDGFLRGNDLLARCK